MCQKQPGESTFSRTYAEFAIPGLAERVLAALVQVMPPVSDWAWVHREIRKKSVTLDLLWQEYKADHSDGYLYSWFCDHYRQWAGKLSVSMRQTHTPGEKLFVDYVGETLPITDGATGEIRQAQLFVAVLGASNSTYAEATWTQKPSRLLRNLRGNIKKA